MNRAQATWAVRLNSQRVRPASKAATLAAADSIRQSSSAGRVHNPLPSIRAWASRRSRAIPVVS